MSNEIRNEKKQRGEKAAARYNVLKVIAECYSTGEFEKLYPYLADDCVWESQWRWDPEVGKEAVIKYFDAKGKALRESNSCPKCTIVRLVGSMNPVKTDNLNVNGEKHSGYAALYYDDGKLCIYMGQKLHDTESGVILDVKLNRENLIKRIDICMPELFRYEPYNPM